MSLSDDVSLGFRCGIALTKIRDFVLREAHNPLRSMEATISAREAQKILKFIDSVWPDDEPEATKK